MNTPLLPRTNLAKHAYMLLRGRLRWLVWTFGILVAFPAIIVFAEYCWQYVDLFLADNPKPWECTAPPPSGSAPADVSDQRLIDQHFNWHCINGHLGAAPGLGTGPGFFDAGYGRQFLADHKQLINDFDLFRDSSMALERIETWDPNDFPSTSPNYNPMPWGIPGSGVSAADAGAIAGGTCLNGTGRSGNGVDPNTFTACPNCDVLPSQFRVPPFGTLDSFATADALGIALDAGTGWHGSFHGGIAAATDANGNSCNDMNPPRTSPRDAMFWRAHKSLDDVHSSWQQLAAADVMIVFDRSGSMAQPSAAGSPVSKLNAAKSAAEMFADLLEDGQGHNLGLVSFSTAATNPPDLGLTSADGVLPTLQATLAGISAGGNTAIGDGLLEAQTELTSNGSNERKAVLLLTDGKENQPPCIDGTGFGCLGGGSDIAPGAFGDTQVCVVGYGDESSLDGIVLRDLAERQAGIYTSGVGDLQLKKFFVDCFADIFDEFPAVDPFGVLPARAKATDPIVVDSAFDTKITFIVAWENRGDPLGLEITTPSGKLLDLNDPAIESSTGDTWHFVRVPLPYAGMGPGQWRARAVRLDQPGRDQPYFINALVSGPARLDPINLRLHAYTGQPFWPTVQIKAPFRPLDEFDRVDAQVIITRPLQGTGNLLAQYGLGQPSTNNGDAVNARTVRLQELAKEFGNQFIPTETLTFSLNDAGKDGDRFANNGYWSAQLPDFAKVEGHYRMTFLFTITEKGRTFRREVNQSVYVEVAIDPEATKASIEPLQPDKEGRQRTRYQFTPRDSLGNYLGPGRRTLFELVPRGDVRIEQEEEDGRGTYQVTVSWTKEQGEPALALQQNSGIRQTLLLPDGKLVRGMPAPESHFEKEPQPPVLPPANGKVVRAVSNLRPAPGEVISVTLTPAGFETYNYSVLEDIGGLIFTGKHSADANPAGTQFGMLKPLPFTYQVQIPADAGPGQPFTLRGDFWNDPSGRKDEQSIGETTVTVQAAFEVYIPAVQRSQ